ncbi:hypothetical protein MSP8887_04022 [Marinomonas spartinae]|uniref:hypothetical protein n=1 Tax=Marinomonas spartinae TaxID=1792290 RepID=UPI000808DAA9|nr:hypothetical protein [Marinomonas spartinae]SBS39822.1 hypothetical protein MSP8887_04022 [Marinomonas spartinae]
MKVTTSKTIQKEQQDTPESRFNNAWQRIVNQRKKNQQLQKKMNSFTETTMEQLQAPEQDYASILYVICEQFLVFYQRKSLSNWQRETLMEWFMEHYQFLRSSPFVGHLDLDSLASQCQKAIVNMHPEIAEEVDNLWQEDGLDIEDDLEDDDSLEGDDPFTEDMFESLFSDFIQNEASDEQDTKEDIFSEFFRKQKAENEKQQHEEKELDKLMKTGALNKLFRKILRQLHPDLEQDEDRRKAKNQLVSQLTDARDNGDIGTIFTMYAEHIGESPLRSLGDADLDNATKVLQRQFEQLRDQKDDILFEAGPIAAAIYSRFHRKTKKATQEAINDHIKELQQDTQSLKEFSVYVTSIAKLKPYLEDRYDRQFYVPF